MLPEQKGINLAGKRFMNAGLSFAGTQVYCTPLTFYDFMEYSKLVAVTGLPGLYELVNSKNDGA
ncbi:MAG: hypothetical protein ACHQFX_12860, partial [Chitinophagales bacterium]